MITFIVTTYNLEDWLLRRCLNSIVGQGLLRDEFEIIVVDDGSAVSPQHVIDEFVELVDVTLYVQKHARQGAARNLALLYAKGDWIQFVDGDDYLFEGVVRATLIEAEINGLDMLMFGFREVYGAEIEEGKSSDYTLSPITTGQDYMIRHTLFGSCCMLIFRRQLCDERIYGSPLRFSEDIYMEDEEFVTKLVWRARRMAVANLVAYAYYQRPNSTVRNRGKEHADELFRSNYVVLQRLLDFENSLEGVPHEGLIRKIHFLAVDNLRLSFRQPNWKERFRCTVCQLRQYGLYPIPLADYSWKYRAFRVLVQCCVGRYILRMIEKNN